MGKCGCGRSATGECVGLHRLTPEDWALLEQYREATKAQSAPKEDAVE